jgi:hypothetical protein
MRGITGMDFHPLSHQHSDGVASLFWIKKNYLINIMKPVRKIGRKWHVKRGDKNSYTLFSSVRIHVIDMWIIDQDSMG